MFANLTTPDLAFVLTAVAFNLLIAAIFIAQKLEREELVKTFGILWLWLIIPLALVFVAYWQAGREARTLFYFGLIFLYMLVELLLDYVFKVDFRSKPITHVPYIILEYIALFSLIAIAFDIDQRWGTVVSLCFWILMGSLVLLYWDKIVKRKKQK
jgi:hypothetical protein